MNQPANFDKNIDYQLAISIVIYSADKELLYSTVESLDLSVKRAIDTKSLKNAILVLIDNGPADHNEKLIKDITDKITHCRLHVIRNNENIGFGRGHNLCFSSVNSEYYLVLNPDVILDKDAIKNAIDYSGKNQDIALISPAASDANNKKLYLCKQFPSLLDLLIRGLDLKCLNRIFRDRLDSYELRGLTEDRPYNAVTIASGCFMFMKRKVIDNLSGFAPEYFLYFEDFDLSRRIVAAGWKIAYVPGVSVIHCGGYASKKGLRHILLFLKSAMLFFSRHGWKII